MASARTIEASIDAVQNHVGIRGMKTEDYLRMLKAFEAVKTSIVAVNQHMVDALYRAIRRSQQHIVVDYDGAAMLSYAIERYPHYMTGNYDCYPPDIHDGPDDPWEYPKAETTVKKRARMLVVTFPTASGGLYQLGTSDSAALRSTVLRSGRYAHG